MIRFFRVDVTGLIGIRGRCLSDEDFHPDNFVRPADNFGYHQSFNHFISAMKTSVISTLHIANVLQDFTDEKV